MDTRTSAALRLTRLTRRIRRAIAATAALLAAGACSGESDQDTPESGRYRESPMLRERVEAGELPPVEERLPDEPLVVETPQTGEYGGSIGGGRVIQSDEWRPTR